MKKHKSRQWLAAIGLLTAFALWTWALGCIDVRPIGPGGSAVGFAGLNRIVHDFTGVHMGLYTLTDWLGLVPLATALGFGILGLIQWIKRKNIQKVDRSILLLGMFYIAVAAVYVFFEKHVINYRPVRIEGALESSYPSSTTLLTLCVMPTAALQLKNRIKSRNFRGAVGFSITGFTVFMVTGRLLSGVHWITDIIGGIMLSAGLVASYKAAVKEDERKR